MLDDKQYSLLESMVEADLRTAENNAQSMPVSEWENPPFYIHHLINLKAIREEIRVMQQEYREVKWIRLNNDTHNTFEDTIIDKVWIKNLSENTLSIMLAYQDGTETFLQYTGNYLLEWE